MDKLLNRLNRKFGKYALQNIMMILTGGMLVVGLATFFTPDLGIESWIDLRWSLVCQGQLWRLVTFLFVPPTSSPIWLVLALYFNYLIGNSLEHEWGAFRFNVFYLVGWIGMIVVAALTGYGTNYYLHMAMFFSFAIYYPDFTVMLFFILPVKIKYLAILDAAYFVYLLIFGNRSIRLLVLCAVLNVLLFFGETWLKHFKTWLGYQKTRRNFRKYMR